MSDRIIDAEVIAELAEKVREAQVKYDSAEFAEQKARGDATAALNAMNEAQREFDKAVEMMRNTAPFNSDWREKSRRRAERAA